ncbi:peptidylprolyl isomerase [Nanoarchaeota archaeon]
MPIKKHDFVEVEYTGQLPEGFVFDTTDEKIAKENDLYNEKMKYGPITICVGENNILPGLDEFLEGKELNKEYTVELTAENGFGKKDAKKIRLIPARAFKKTDIHPQVGLQVDIDNEIGTILRADSGRILVDFNHPLSGKDVVYKIKVNKEITEPKEKIEALMKMSLNLPGIKVDVQDNKATITMPLEIPEPAQEPIKKKIIELTKVKEVTFSKTLGKKPSNESEKLPKEGLENQKDSQKPEVKTEPQKPEENNQPSSQD